MIRIIKEGDTIHEFVEIEGLMPVIDENGKVVEVRETVFYPQFKDPNYLRECLKDTVSWYTDRYIQKHLQSIDEDLQDLATEQTYLEGVFYALGVDPNKIKALVTQIILGQKSFGEAFAETGLPKEYESKFMRALEIAKIIAWKERIWDKEAEIEARIMELPDEELENFDVIEVCNKAYAEVK